MHSRAARGLRVALLALLAFAVVAGSASASVVIPPADDDLIVHADAVIIGRVTDIESHDDQQGKLSTYITIAIQEVLKGSLAQSSLTIRELGGEVGGVVAWASANPEFSVGERVLLFLDQRADGSLRVLHFYLGKFSIITDPATGDLVAVRPLPDEVTIIAPPGAAAAGIALGAVGRGLDEFKDHIRHRAGEARPLTARPSVALPLASATIPPDGATERHQEFRFLRDPNPPGATDPNLVQPRFSQPDTNVPIVMHFNGTSEPLAPAGSNGGRNQVRDAFRAWSAVPTTSYRYVEGGDTTAEGFTADGINAISFRDPHGEISPPSNCGGVLAIGGMRFFATASMTVNGRQFSQAVEADLVFADGWDSCMVFYQNYANFAEVATHELGHALGLGHSEVSTADSTGLVGAIMGAFAHFDGRGARLHDDDKAGVTFIYPGRTLTIVKTGSGSATITSGTAGINCGADCVAGFAPNTSVTLTVTPDPGTRFQGFAEPGCGTELVSTVVMSTDRTCTASLTTAPELLMSAISGPPTAAPGATVVLNNTVRNTGLMAGAFNVGLYLAGSSTVTTGDRQLTTRRVTSLATGAISADATSVQIPSDVNPGNYFLGGIADVDGEVAEGNENNNAASTPILIAKPDLVVTVLTAPATAGAGLSITVNSTVKNQASAAVTAAASTLAFYLSTDATFDGGDVRLTATRAIPTLAKDATSAGATTLTIPAGIAAGSYFLIAVADDLSAVAESNEGNNTRTAPIAISRPDLSVTSVTATPTLTAAGMNVSITQIVRNLAPSPANAPGSSSRLTLSDHDTLGVGVDADLGTVAIPALAAATQATVTKSVVIPVGTGPGRYWIFARANDGDVIPEGGSGGANNAVRTALPITIGPDLVVSAATATPVITAPGLTVSVSNTVKNQGGAAAGPFDVGVYLSANNAYDDGVDLLLNTLRVTTGLAPGAMSLGVVPVVIPANQSAGSYFLIVRADIIGSAPGEVAEANEANNILVVPLTVVRADLVVTSVTAPAVAAAGTNVSITHVVKNLAAVAGGAPATSSRLFLSADATLDGSDVQLGGDLQVGALAGGATATVTKSVLIPSGTAPGRYFVIAQANATGTVVEADDTTLPNTNNRKATPIIIGPDLVVSAATLAPTATAPGMTVNVTNSVKNQGGAGVGAFTVGIYLSPDNVFDASDTLLSSRVVLSLAAGAVSGPIVTPVVIPANQSAGSHFLFVRVDTLGSVPEADETNNGLMVPLTVVRPDLTVQSVTATPRAIAPGANVSVTHVVRNVAVAAGVAPTTFSQLFLSSDATLDGGDDPLSGNLLVGPLAGGAMATVTKSVQIPIGKAPGLYWIIARANATNSALETDSPGQANDVRTLATPIIVGPDVLLTAASTVATATPGMNVSVMYTLKNQGGQAATNFDVAFALVPQTGGGDIPIGPSRTGVSLAAGATMAFANAVTIPAGTTLGAYKIKVTANASGAVIEADESNNTFLSGTLTVLRPDLTVPTVTFTPAVIAPGGNITVSHVVKNVALAPGNVAPSTSRLLLSTDQTTTGQVADLGAVNVPAITAGGMTTVTRPVQIPPSVPPGLYYIVAQADEADLIAEPSQANNTGASATRLVVGPDMTVTVASTVAGAIPGANVSVTYTLKNLGSATSPFTVGFALVPITTSGPDIPVGPTHPAVVLATNATLASTSTVGVPSGLAAGQYRVRVIADPNDAVVEAMETNNSATTGILTITPPDVRIQSLTVPGTGIAGRHIGIPNTVVNSAFAPGTAPSFQVGLFLASGAVIDPATDTPLASRTVASLAPAAVSTATTSVTLPTSAGNYFIGAVADRSGTVVEATEGNNQMSSAIAVVPDMVRPSGPAAAQLTLASCLIPANNGTAMLNGTFVVPTQTGAAWTGTVKVNSGPQINTMTVTGTVTIAGTVSGTFTIANSAGARGTGSFTGTVAPPAGSPGAVTATFNGSFTVGEACTISGSFSSP